MYVLFLIAFHVVLHALQNVTECLLKFFTLTVVNYKCINF
jgi:hypothetical protein